MEPELTISLTASEVSNLGKLLDVAIRNGGVDAAKAALPIYVKIESAVAAFNKAQQKEAEQ